MTNNDVRRAHGLLDLLKERVVLSQEQEKLLRSFLPEVPKQKTLEEITAHVYDAWMGSNDNEWAGNSYDTETTLESWLVELYDQLTGLVSAKSAHPEFLETEADYTNAPVGTVVARDNGLPWVKEKSNYWTRPDAAKSDYGMSLGSRRVLRWGWGE